MLEAVVVRWFDCLSFAGAFDWTACEVTEFASSS